MLKFLNRIKAKEEFPDVRPLLSEMGLVEDSFLVGFNEHINKRVYTYNHCLIPYDFRNSFSFKNSSKQLDNGEYLVNSNYIFSDSFIRSDLVPFEGSVRSEWRIKKYDVLVRWLTEENEKYKTKGFPYATLDENTMRHIITDFYNEVKRLSDGDAATVINLAALLIANNFQDVPQMVHIAKRATSSEITIFVELLSKAEDMKLPIEDYQLLFDTMVP